MRKKKEIISDERRTGDLTNMNNLLWPLAKKMLGKKAFVEADVFRSWKDIVGDEIAQFSKPLKIEFDKEKRNNGTLLLEVASGAMALMIQTKSRVMIDKINTFFGYDAVCKIKILQNMAMDKNKTDIHNLEKKLVTIQEQTYIKKLVEEIKTPGLAKALEKLGRNVIMNNKK